jgi:hypothetical protein
MSCSATVAAGGLGGALGLVIYIVCILVAWVAVAIVGVLVAR